MCIFTLAAFTFFFILSLFFYYKEKALKHRVSLHFIDFVNSINDLDEKEKDLEAFCDKVMCEFPYYSTAIDALYLYYAVKTELNKKTLSCSKCSAHEVSLYKNICLAIYRRNHVDKTKEHILQYLELRVKILSVLNYPSIDNLKRIDILNEIGRFPLSAGELNHRLHNLKLIANQLNLIQSPFKNKMTLSLNNSYVHSNLIHNR